MGPSGSHPVPIIRVNFIGILPIRQDLNRPDIGPDEPSQVRLEEGEIVPDVAVRAENEGVGPKHPELAGSGHSEGADVVFGVYDVIGSFDDSDPVAGELSSNESQRSSPN